MLLFELIVSLTELVSQFVGLFLKTLCGRLLFKSIVKFLRFALTKLSIVVEVLWAALNTILAILLLHLLVLGLGLDFFVFCW